MIRHWRIIVVVVFISITTQLSFAGWLGPYEVVVGTWGSEPGQFHFFAGDNFDFFPKDIGITAQRNIFVNDKSNCTRYLFMSPKWG